MATNNCGHDYDCNCEPYVNEQCPPPQPPECEEPCTPCDEVTPSQCVIYTGPNIECIGVTTGMPLDTVIGLLAAKACETPEPPTPPDPPTPPCVVQSCENLNLSSPQEGCQSPVQFMLNETLIRFCNQYPDVDDCPCASPVQHFLSTVIETSNPTAPNGAECDLYPDTADLTSNNKENCKSSLDYTLDLLFDKFDPEDPESFGDVLKLSLEFFRGGILISNDNCDVPICCHECCDDGYYILSGVAGALAVFSALGQPKCCANSYFSTTTSIEPIPVASISGDALASESLDSTKESFVSATRLFSAFSTKALKEKNPLLFGTIPQCCTDQSFYECVQTMGNELNIVSELLSVGIVETQYANNDTLICKLYDKVKDPALGLTIEQQADFILTFLQNGFVTLCCNGQVFMGGLLAFAGLLQDNLIPCITIPVEFGEIGPFCQNYTIELPDTSENGIVGTWSPSVVDTSVAGTFDYVFTSVTPPGLTETVSIVITPAVAPTFGPIGDILPGYVAQGSVPPTLPAISLEGVTGNWSPAVIDTSTLGTFTYTFSPNQDVEQPICADSVDVTIIIYDPLNPPG